MALPYLTNPAFGYGSYIATMTTGNANGVTFIMEESDHKEPTAQTTRTTEVGAPNGWIGFSERRTLRGKMQVATNVTNYPDRGDEFIYPRKTTGSNFVNVTFAIVEIDEPKRARDFWSLETQFLEKV